MLFRSKRKEKQLEALMFFLKLLYADPDRKWVVKKNLLSQERISASAVQSLIKNNILKEFEVRVDRLPVSSTQLVDPFPLTEGQETALNNISSGFSEKEVMLLHGVTSSGKTEIYMHLIREAIRRGKQEIGRAHV